MFALIISPQDFLCEEQSISCRRSMQLVDVRESSLHYPDPGIIRSLFRFRGSVQGDSRDIVLHRLSRVANCPFFPAPQESLMGRLSTPGTRKEERLGKSLFVPAKFSGIDRSKSPLDEPVAWLDPRFRIFFIAQFPVLSPLEMANSIIRDLKKIGGAQFYQIRFMQMRIFRVRAQVITMNRQL